MQENFEQTYIMVKPDGVQRGLASLSFLSSFFVGVIVMFYILLGCSENLLLCKKFQILVEFYILYFFSLGPEDTNTMNFNLHWMAW